MVRFFSEDESQQVSHVACETAFALMLLKRKEPNKVEKELVKIKDGLKLLDLLELAEQFIIKTKDTTPEEDDAYHFLRRAFFRQKLQPGDWGYETVEQIIDLHFTKVLFRISKLREGIKEKLGHLLDNPQDLSEEESAKCQRFFNSLAASTQ